MALTKAKLIADGVIVAANLHSSHGITSANIGENTNLYFTNARARSAISVSGNALSYNSSTGVITSNFEESPAFTGNVDVAGNITVGGNDSILAENNLRFKSSGAAYIDHNTTGQAINFRTSVSSSLDTTPLVLLGAAVLVGQSSAVSNHLLTVNGKIGGPTFSDSYLQFTSGNVLLKANDDIKLGYNQNVIVKQSGSVGIGTTSPEEKLDISGSVIINNNEFYKVENTSGTNYKIAGLTSGNMIQIGAIDYTSAGTIFAGGDNVSITTGGAAGTTRIKIDSSGNVGIGLTSPAVKLEIQDSTHTTMKIRSGNNDNILFLQALQSDEARIGTDTNSAISFFTNTSRRMTITTSGLVGIGTNLPQNKLHVKTNASGASSFDSRNKIILENNGEAYFSSYVPANSYSGIRFHDASGLRGFIDYYHGTQGDTLVYSATNHHRFLIGSSEKMRLDSSGKLGIGTTSPAQPVHLLNGGFAYMRFTSQGYGSTGFDIGQHTNGNIYLNNRDNTSMVFMTNNAERMNIVANGEVNMYNTLNINSPSGAGNKGVQIKHSNNNKAAELIHGGTGDEGMLKLYDSNSETVRIAGENNVASFINSGNLGIGTTNPGAKLDIGGDLRVGNVGSTSSTTNYETVLRVKGKNNYSDGTTWYGDYGQIILHADTNMTGSARRYMITSALNNNKFAIVRSVDGNTDPLVNSTSGGDAVNSGTADFVITNSGEIGIGTTSPQVKLHVDGGDLRVRDSGNVSLQIVSSTSANSAIQFGDDGDTNDGRIVYENTGDNMLFYTNDSERMRIDSSGNLSLATATSLDFNVADFAQIKFKESGAITIDSDNNQSSRNFQFKDGGGSSLMFIGDNGAIGIGTTSTLAKLHIHGTGDLIRAVSTNTGAGGAQMDLIHHTTSPANNDVHGVINFGGYYSGTSQSYGTSIKSVWTDVGNQHGQLQFFTRDGSYHSQRAKIDMHGHASIAKTHSNSSADVVNTSFNTESFTFQGHGKKFLGMFVIRDGSRYLDVAINSTANNVMYYIYVIGYLYNRGTYVGVTSGYTYTNNSIINHNSGDILDLGVGKSVVSYRGTNSTAGNYTGYLCFRFDSGANGYSEGQLQVYISSHSLSWQKFADVHAVVQNDTTNNYFAQ